LPRAGPERTGPPRGAAGALYGVHPVLEALRARRRSFERVRLRRGLRRPGIDEIRAAAESAGVPVEEVEPEALLAGIPETASTQGVLLDAGPLPEVSLDSLAAEPGLIVALDGVEDPQNVGAIARVAEAVGARGLVLTRRHAPPLGPVVSRSSAGAIEWLPTARVPNLGRALKALKEKGFWVFGCDPEASAGLFDLDARVLGGGQVVVLGAEGRGLRPGILRVLDHRVQIPMRGRVDSLNVATAAAVMLFELRRRAEEGG
jgi:23S rRNA (guanosine2251-2'-O)-methyltransferase